jgi:phenylpropionate dioxygenase-like ring-hydroxylating dioxygenase large terminal subunit
MTELLEAMAATCGAPSPAEAFTLPPQAYGSKELFDLETERVFKAGWLPLCRVEQVAEPNSYYSADILGMPLVVTRDRTGELHVLSRSCRHRWMDVCSGSGTAKSLQCPYHLWSYGLDGHLGGAPEMAGSTGFKREDYALRPYRHEVWQGFICVNLDGTATSLNEQMAGLTDVVAPYDLANYTTVASTDWGTCPWDWKVMIDNFMECYHHMGPHRASLEAEFPARLSYIDPGGDHYSVMWSAQAPGYPANAPFLKPLGPNLREEHERKSLIFTAYPLLGVAMGPAYMYWLKIMPVGPGEMKLQLDIAMSPEAMKGDDFEARKATLIEMITGIHREDIDACTRVQAAINSGAADVGRLSLLEQALWEFYQYLGRELDIDSLATPIRSASALSSAPLAEAG